MEFNRCGRCGSFYLSAGNVCPKCSEKDGFEFSTFKTYLQENGFDDSLDVISNQTGISLRNLSRFMGYPEFKKCAEEYENNLKNQDIEFTDIKLD